MKINLTNLLQTVSEDKKLSDCAKSALLSALNCLAELEDKLESGQLKEIKYPCNIGDRVYVICSRTSNDKNLYIREGICDELRVAKNEAGGYWLWVSFKGGWSVFEWQFDRVFHTQEQAETRLKELQEKL